MSQPVFTPDEIKGVGEDRWSAKNGKRYFALVIGVILLGYGDMKLAQLTPGKPIGLILAALIVIGFIIAYRKYIHAPTKKAGKEFLEQRPITMFDKDKTNDG
jgi:drug/metabolite transporter (DMT)-like permease